MREKLWLRVLDAVVALGFGWTPIYYWVLKKASDAVDWGAIESSPGDGEPPF